MTGPPVLTAITAACAEPLNAAAINNKEEAKNMDKYSVFRQILLFMTSLASVFI